MLLVLLTWDLFLQLVYYSILFCSVLSPLFQFTSPAAVLFQPTAARQLETVTNCGCLWTTCCPAQTNCVNWIPFLSPRLGACRLPELTPARPPRDAAWCSCFRLWCQLSAVCCLDSVLLAFHAAEAFLCWPHKQTHPASNCFQSSDYPDSTSNFNLGCWNTSVYPRNEKEHQSGSSVSVEGGKTSQHSVSIRNTSQGPDYLK